MDGLACIKRSIQVPVSIGKDKLSTFDIFRTEQPWDGFVPEPMKYPPALRRKKCTKCSEILEVRVSANNQEKRAFLIVCSRRYVSYNQLWKQLKEMAFTTFHPCNSEQKL
jgi:hypothetical protein